MVKRAMVKTIWRSAVDILNGQAGVKYLNQKQLSAKKA
jgi:hypothetical protein